MKICHKKKETEYVTRPAAPSGRYATRRRKQNKQHRACSPVRKIFHKKKETEQAAQGLQPRQEDMPQEDGNRTCNRACSPVRKICHKKKETEHVTRPAVRKICHKKMETEQATYALQPRQEDMPQEEGSRTCSTLFFCLACVGPTSGH
jgi:hypothetical protein